MHIHVDAYMVVSYERFCSHYFVILLEDSSCLLVTIFDINPFWWSKHESDSRAEVIYNLLVGNCIVLTILQ